MLMVIPDYFFDNLHRWGWLRVLPVLRRYYPGASGSPFAVVLSVSIPTSFVLLILSHVVPYQFFRWGFSFWKTLSEYLANFNETESQNKF